MSEPAETSTPQSLPVPAEGPESNYEPYVSSSFRDTRLAKAVATVLAACFLVLVYLISPFSHHSIDTPLPRSCPQVEFILPQFEELGLHNSSFFTTREYEQKSIELLAGAVRIPTVSFDDMSFNVTEDPRFDVFHELHSYLFAQFPRLAKHVEFVNTYGLLYTIKGKNESLKPFVLAAHQDVVPVPPESADEWLYEPFSGVFDGEFLYGRGTSDTKNLLVAIHEAAEALLAQKWVPERTILLSFGFDEEIQGFRGARKLAEVIEERYGEVEMLIDEGRGVVEQYGALFAIPAVNEKGRVNFRATLFTKGGHSSAPPDHTGIGVMADLVTRLEDQVPFEASLPEIVKQNYACIGELAPVEGNPDSHKRKDKKHRKHRKHKRSAEQNLIEFSSITEENELPVGQRFTYTHLYAPGKIGAQAVSELTEQLASERGNRVYVETTQAIDIIRGGVKINALPEQTVMEVNYRINPVSSVESERDRFLSIVRQAALDFGLSVNYSNPFAGETDQVAILPPPSSLLANQSGGFLHIETIDALPVAPVSPFNANSTHWQLLSGTVRHVLSEVMQHEFPSLPVYVAPGLMTGNTDTAHYWNVTHNLYRFIPGLNDDMINIHTVNEGLRPRSHISTVAYVYEMLVNLKYLQA